MGGCWPPLTLKVGQRPTSARSRAPSRSRESNGGLPGAPSSAELTECRKASATGGLGGVRDFMNNPPLPAMGGVQTQILDPPQPPPPPVGGVEEVWTTFGPDLVPNALEIFFWASGWG